MRNFSCRTKTVASALLLAHLYSSCNTSSHTEALNFKPSTTRYYNKVDDNKNKTCSLPHPKNSQGKHQCNSEDCFNEQNTEKLQKNTCIKEDYLKHKISNNVVESKGIKQSPIKNTNKESIKTTHKQFDTNKKQIPKQDVIVNVGKYFPENGIPNNLACFFSKENHKVALFYQNNQLKALIETNCPKGFSRTLVLPVLISDDFAKLAAAIKNLGMMRGSHSLDQQELELQKDLASQNKYDAEKISQMFNEKGSTYNVHVFPPEHPSVKIIKKEDSIRKNGLVYIGFVGLRGGGFWGWFGCIAGAVVGTIVTAGVGVAIFGGVAAFSTLGTAAVAYGGLACVLGGAYLGGLIGGVWGYQHDLYLANKKETEVEYKKKAEELRKAEEKVKANLRFDTDKSEFYNTINRVISQSEISSDSIQTTKNFKQLRSVVEGHDRNISAILDSKYRIARYRNEEYTRDRSSEAYECEWEADRKIQEISELKQKDIDKARKDALEEFGECTKMIYSEIAKNKEAGDWILEKIAAPKSSLVNKTNEQIVEGNINSMNLAVNKMQENLVKLNEWKNEYALSFHAEDGSKVQEVINSVIKSQNKFNIARELIDFATKNPLKAKKLSKLTAPNVTCDDFKNGYKEAVRAGEIFVLKYIIEYKEFSINSQNGKHNTMLHWAIRANKPEVIKYLMSHGIDTTIKNEEGETAKDLAKQKGVVL